MEEIGQGIFSALIRIQLEREAREVERAREKFDFGVSSNGRFLVYRLRLMCSFKEDREKDRIHYIPEREKERM